MPLSASSTNKAPANALRSASTTPSALSSSFNYEPPFADRQNARDVHNSAYHLLGHHHSLTEWKTAGDDERNGDVGSDMGCVDGRFDQGAQERRRQG